MQRIYGASGISVFRHHRLLFNRPTWVSKCLSMNICSQENNGFLVSAAALFGKAKPTNDEHITLIH